jgi:DNA repair exonuclease SbcCD ATPase subunit
MRLISLSLNNFKGIRNFTLDAQGEDVSGYGDNATGKTTLSDAFMWLLFDKDSANRKDFEIKTLGPDGKPEHGLDHSVEAVLELEDGSHLALKKVFKEKWTKKRGSATAEFTGHTTDHFIDGVPVKKGEYDARIANIASEDIFKLLTSPTYFNEHLHWQDRREILLQVCGDISDGDVLDSLATLQNKDQMLALTNILNTRSLDDHRKIIQARRTEINKELDKIPVRIDEADMAKPDISTVNNPKALQADIKVVKESIKKENEKLARLESGGEVAEKTKKLREIEAEILNLTSKARAENVEKIKELQAKASDIQMRIVNHTSMVNSIEETNRDRNRQILLLTEQKEKLRKKWYQQAQEEFEPPEQSNICPTCGQPIPEEQLQAAIEKAKTEFNLRKAEQLESINAEGKQLKAQIEELRQKIADAEKIAAESEENIRPLKTELDSIEAQIEALRREESIKYDPEIRELTEKKATIEQEIESLKAGNTEAREKVVDGIQELEEILSTLEECQAKVKMRKSLDDRIEKLKAQEKKLAAEYERLEGELYLTEEFIRQKVSLLEEKINSKFEMARFKLFNVLVNGAVEECCETTYQGVPFGSLNNGARINVGLDIIRTLAKHYNFYPPIFIDNREAVTSLIDMGDQQVISLIVSEKDKELRVEIEGEKEKEVA